MRYIYYFLLTAVCTQGVHAYLLISQRNSRQWSISVHAVKNTQAYVLYVLGHVLGGAFFVLFARDYFYQLHDVKLIFYIACLAVLFEYIQAFLPAKGKTNAPHTLAAYLMWILFISVNILSYFLLPLSLGKQLIAGPFLLVSVVMFIYVHFNHKRLYYYQAWMLALFLLAMFVMVI